MAQRFSFKQLFAEPFLVFYLVMLGTVFYLAFVNTGGGDMGKAADSPVYSGLWIGVYALLLIFIVADLPRLPKGLGIVAILIAINVIDYAMYGFQPASPPKLLSLVMTFVFAGWAANRFTTDRLFEIFFSTAAIVGVFHLAAYPLLHNLAQIYDPLERQSMIGLKPYAGLFAHKNHAGTFFAMALVSGVARVLSRSGQFTMLRGFGILILLICLLMTGAVGPLLTAGLCIGLMILLMVFRLSVGLGLLIGTITASIMIVLYLFPDLWVGAVGRDPTFTGRQYLYDSWFTYFSRRPLTGYGYGEAFSGTPDSIGAHINVMSSAWAHYMNFESGILQCAIDFGIAGLLLYAFMFLRAVVYSGRNIEGVYIRDRLLPAALTFYVLVSSMNEILIVAGNTLPIAVIFFFYCKATARFEGTRRPSLPRPSLHLSGQLPADSPAGGRG